MKLRLAVVAAAAAAALPGGTTYAVTVTIRSAKGTTLTKSRRFRTA